MIAIITMASCSSNPQSRVRIVKTGEKAFVSVTPRLYQKGDTVIVYYSQARALWKVDENWIQFPGTMTLTSAGIFYKAVIE